MIRNDSEFLQCALKHYDNPKINSLSEFESDVKKFGMLNMLLTRYKGDLGKKERLILNYIVILQNCFGTEAIVQMLRHKIHKDNTNQLDTYMFFLNMIPNGDIDLQLLTTLQEL